MMIKGNLAVRMAFSNAEMLRHYILFNERMGAADVRNQEWKLVRLHAASPWELYRINEDRIEKKNQADHYPEIFSQLDSL